MEENSFRTFRCITVLSCIAGDINYRKDTKLSRSSKKLIFPQTVWVRKPMFTAQNSVWFPNRGCKNLVLPYHSHSDSKSFHTPALNEMGKLTYTVAPQLDTVLTESGTSVDGPNETGTCVDALTVAITPIEYGTNVVALAETGTNVDGPIEIGTSVDALYVYTALSGNGTSVDAPQIDAEEYFKIGTSVDTGVIPKLCYKLTDFGTVLDTRFLQARKREREKESEKEDPSYNRDIDNLTNNNVDVLNMVESTGNETPSDIANPANNNVETVSDEQVIRTEIISDIVYLANNDRDVLDVEEANILRNEEANVKEMLSEIVYPTNNNEDTLSDEEGHGEDMQNDGSSNDSSEEAEQINLNVSSSFTYLAFWNYNNCNSLSTKETHHILGNMAGSYINGMPEIQRSFKSFRYFPVTDKEHFLYENPGEYIFVQGTHGYAHIKRNPNRNWSLSGKSGWWSKLVCWSCRICALGILVIFGYCLNGKFKDICLYQ